MKKILKTILFCLAVNAMAIAQSPISVGTPNGSGGTSDITVTPNADSIEINAGGDSGFLQSASVSNAGILTASNYSAIGNIPQGRVLGRGGASGVGFAQALTLSDDFTFSSTEIGIDRDSAGYFVSLGSGNIAKNPTGGYTLFETTTVPANLGNPAAYSIIANGGIFTNGLLRFEGSIIDNRSNSFFQQSASNVLFNRDATFLNNTYARFILSSQAFHFAPSTGPSGNYFFEASAGTLTSGNGRDIFFKCESTTAAGVTGGDFLIQRGTAGSGLRDGRMGIFTLTPRLDVDVVGTEGIGIPRGTTAQRPAATTEAAIRYNTESDLLEASDSSQWLFIGMHKFAYHTDTFAYTGASWVQDTTLSIDLAAGKYTIEGIIGARDFGAGPNASYRFTIDGSTVTPTTVAADATFNDAGDWDLVYPISGWADLTTAGELRLEILKGGGIDDPVIEGGWIKVTKLE